MKKAHKCLKDEKPNRSQREPLETIWTTKASQSITLAYLHLDQCKGGYKHFY